MNYKIKIQQIDSIKKQIESLIPFNQKNSDTFWKKIKLEFNFNSNHLEGNTLTYGETKLLLFFGKISGNHEIREIDEMKAHDVAFELIKEWTKNNLRTINESEIRKLNEIILVKPFYKEGITESGQKTQKKIIPGKYKEFPNHVLLANGQIFKYAEPNEVSFKMKELIDWYRDSNDLHPIEKAALLHYYFVLIHPFDDGNGRISRLLMNYHLIKEGYAPVIIKSSDKKNYLFALNQADAGNIEKFIDYIAEQSQWSMELFLKAVNGESIEEDEDWKKEINLIKKIKTIEPIKCTPEILKERFNDSIFPLIRHLKAQLGTYFDELFDNNNLSCHFNKRDLKYYIINENISSIKIDIFNGLKSNQQELLGAFTWNGYKKNEIHSFNIQIEYLIRFNDYSLNFRCKSRTDLSIVKAYDEKITEDDMNIILNFFGKQLTDQIKKNTN